MHGARSIPDSTRFFQFRKVRQPAFFPISESLRQLAVKIESVAGENRTNDLAGARAAWGRS
jgi:hypothetical protein